jgi:hypothetical protein
MIIAHNPNTLYLNQSFNRYAVDYDGMQGLQKLKCATCGTMFMSETETNTCVQNKTIPITNIGSSGGMGGCGCGH